VAQQPVPTAPAVIDGPDPAIPLPAALGTSVARDGTGGVVYLKQVAGVEHVFVSTFVGGAFSGPQQIDPGLSGDASQPVIAAGNGGLLLIAFVSAGELYVVGRANAQTALSPPVGLAPAANPAISMSNFGKAYLAFVAPDGSGYDVRTAYYYNGRWALEATPLNATPADGAGTGTGRPAVAAAGDGEGIVAWGENGAIFSRRVWGVQASAVYEQADGALPGCSDTQADDPVVATEGDSSYADVAFREMLTCGGPKQQRVLMNRLVGSAYSGLTPADGISSGASGGQTDPQITMTEYGHGLLSSQRTTTNNVYVTTLGEQGVPAGTSAVNGMPESAPPDPVVATAGLFSNLVAWQQQPGSAGVAEIRVRYAPSQSNLGPEMVLSAPAQGPTDAADGLAAAGDVNGDSLVAWIQTTPGGPEIVAARLYQPPGGFPPLKGFQYERSSLPVFAWGAPRESWGPLTYSLGLDGTQILQTTAASARAQSTVSDGPHTWAVTAANPAGQQSSSQPAEVFVDTVPPAAKVTIPARIRFGARAIAGLTYADLPPAGAPASDASGLASAAVGWGDGTTTPLTHGKRFIGHLYTRARRYTITLVVTDNAGNVTRVTAQIRVFKPSPKAKTEPKPKTKAKPEGKPTSQKKARR
jgi:hypothetical protein